MKTQTIIFGNKKDPSAMLRSLMFGRYALEGAYRIRELSLFSTPLSNISINLCYWLKTPSRLMVRFLSWGISNTTRAIKVRIDSLVGLILHTDDSRKHICKLVFEIKFLRG